MFWFIFDLKLLIDISGSWRTISSNVKFAILLNVKVNVIVLLFVLDIYGSEDDIDRVSGEGLEYGGSIVGLLLPTILNACIDRYWVFDTLKLLSFTPPPFSPSSVRQSGYAKWDIAWYFLSDILIGINLLLLEPDGIGLIIVSNNVLLELPITDPNPYRAPLLLIA